MTTLKYTAATLKAQLESRKAENEAAEKAQLEKEINETIAKINDAMETATASPIRVEIGVHTGEVGCAVRDILNKAGFYMMMYNPMTGILTIGPEQVPASPAIARWPGEVFAAPAENFAAPAEKNPFAFPN